MGLLRKNDALNWAYLSVLGKCNNTILHSRPTTEYILDLPSLKGFNSLKRCQIFSFLKIIFTKYLIFLSPIFYYFRIQEFVHSHHTDQNSSICDIRADRSPLLPIRIEKWHRFVHSQMVQRWRRVLPIST